MKKLIGMVFAAILVAATLSARGYADDRSDDLQRIHNSRVVFHELMKTPDKSIPEELLDSAKCIAIIPGELKAAFIVGAKYGKGLATCRTRRGWSAPVFLTVGGGSFGLQIGGSSTDLVLVFRNREGFQHLLSDKFKIGADATAAAGPVGRHTAAATDLEMHAEILTYSRSRGVFAGVSLDGTVVAPDNSADRALYGRGVDREAVLHGRITVPVAARGLVDEIQRYTNQKT
ncbi:MAG: lipid-binding SYLF domain-containing protein [Candidatus Acidiferrum sp.]